MVTDTPTTLQTVEFSSDRTKSTLVEVSVWEGDTEVLVATSGGGEGLAWLTGESARAAAAALLTAADVADRNLEEERRAAGPGPAAA